jgi:hypothetical protein
MEIKKYLAEFLGTFFLVATVIGSGIMGDNLSAGNEAVALLGNTIATGAILYVIIKSFEDLPDNAQSYIKAIETFIEVPITFISVGPERTENIII